MRGVLIPSSRITNSRTRHGSSTVLNQGFRDIFLSPSGINKRRWRLHCMKNGSNFPARYSWRLHWGLLRVKPSLVGLFVCLLFQVCNILPYFLFFCQLYLLGLAVSLLLLLLLFFFCPCGVVTMRSSIPELEKSLG